MAGTGVYGYRLETGGKLEIEGLREIVRDLKGLETDSREDMKETHRRAGQIVVDGATRLVPVRTGALLDSLKSSPTKYMGRVRVGSASVPYAGPIHFGWPARAIKPNPFIYEVLDGRRNEVATLYAERISELVFRHQLAPGQRSTQNRY